MSKIYLLSNKGILDNDIVHMPIFDIEFIDAEIDFSLYDALIFTSKNAVYSLKNQSKSWKKIPSYAISDKTYEILQQVDSNVIFNAKANNGNEFANRIINELNGKKVLYLRASEVVSDLEYILNSNGVNCNSIVTYKTNCVQYSTHKAPPKDSVIIFSSPSSISCFLKNFKLDESYKIVVIGETTAKGLPLGIKYHLASNKSLASCIQIAKKLI